MKTRVSVILPVYNTRAYLRECLDSVLAQDVDPGSFEIVAVDDGSTDGSGEILDEYALRHAFVRVMHQENSGWPGQPRNRGLEASRGEYVFFLDSDDVLGPEAVRRLCDVADEQGERHRRPAARVHRRSGQRTLEAGGSSGRRRPAPPLQVAEPSEALPALVPR